MQIAATNSATPSLQMALSQSRLEQARTEADRAEATAKALRTQADQAEQDSQERQNTLRSLRLQEAQAPATYDATAQTGAQALTPRLLSRLYSASSQGFSDSGSAPTRLSGASPVFGSQGLTAGRILNVAA